jgi:hypothetical protein
MAEAFLREGPTLACCRELRGRCRKERTSSQRHTVRREFSPLLLIVLWSQMLSIRANRRTNSTTAEETARAVLPTLEESGGCLLFISSIAALEAIGAPMDYSVAKAALVTLT